MWTPPSRRPPLLALALLTCLAAPGRAGVADNHATADRHGANAGTARGPLRVHPDNPRYFTDGRKAADGGLRAVYLTGSHTWPNLIDRGPSDPPPAFDFDRYLDFLERHDHNFIRLWARHVTWYHDYGVGERRVLHAGPLAWPRTGPGIALDGKPKFDLTRFNEAYFHRLRERVAAARGRGIYVGVMLFGGYYECTGGWRGNPFNAANNVNGIDGDPDRDGRGLETHTLTAPAVLRLQEAYVRKVIDTVNDLDNVLYEIGNECHTSSWDWQDHLIRFVRDYERGKPKQHPVGMTALWGDDPKQDNRVLYESKADWVSPQVSDAEVRADLPAADGRKVSLLDSDHWFISAILKDADFGRDWVWKAFCRGHNPILMEQVPLDSGSEVPVTTEDPGHVAARRAMGQTRRFAERVNLAAMTPAGELASTGFCLADPGREYLVYLPDGGPVTVDLSAANGELAAEWFDPVRGKTVVAGRVPGGARRELRSPLAGAAVLYLKAGQGAKADAAPAARLDDIRRVEIGPNREVRVNGEPFFPIGSWAQANRRYPLLRELGFNTFVGGGGGAAEACAAAARAGGYAVTGFDEAVKGHPALLAYAHGDEPDLGLDKGQPRKPAREVVDAYRRLRERDASRPVFLNLTSAFMAEKGGNAPDRKAYYQMVTAGADILCFDVYPIYGYNRPDKLTWVADGVRDLRAYAGPNQPVFAFIETAKGSRWVSYERQLDVRPEHTRAEVWMAIIRGATGVVYFTHAWRPAFTEFAPAEPMRAELKRLNAQITRLAPVILSAPAEERVTVSFAGGLTGEVTARRHAGALYLFANNLDMNGRAGAATFTVEGLRQGARVEVLDESRHLTARDGGFADDFAPLAVHLYRIPLGG